MHTSLIAVFVAREVIEGREAGRGVCYLYRVPQEVGGYRLTAKVVYYPPLPVRR